jgi:hypothetical protein
MMRPISGVPLGTLVGHLEQHLVRSSKEPPTVSAILVAQRARRMGCAIHSSFTAMTQGAIDNLKRDGLVPPDLTVMLD